MSADKLSDKERYYQTQSVFKRNKRYIDSDNIDRLNNLLEKQRRKPQSRSLSSRQRFDSSFRNSKQAFQTKLTYDIEKFKSRISVGKDKSTDADESVPNTPRTSFAQDNYISPKKIRGIPLNLVLPRKDIVPKSKDPLDERLFNNFKLEAPDTSRTMDFSKRLGRVQKNDVESPQQTEVDIVKKHEQFYCKQTTLKCLFSYKVQKDDKGRVWMVKKRQEDVCQNDIDPDKVRAGFQYASGYPTTKTNPFYNNSGRQLPPQLQMRRMNSNENHYVNQEGKFVRPKLQFSLRNQRQYLKDKRMSEIKGSKTTRWQRDNICMQMYFRRAKDKDDFKITDQV